MTETMTKNLVIVESPAKAKTIEKFLGQNYVVKSSFGHIRDLPKKGLNIDINKGFEPFYEISPDKLKVVQELKTIAKKSEVWLASDEDREGEAIAWHLSQALQLNPSKTKRIVFHEITKPAIEHAINNPRVIDLKLVEAQQARRVLDRLVGYELSPILWKKVKGGLSAGRVQSVAVRLIVDREREIKQFASQSYYKILAQFQAQDEVFSAELSRKIKTIKNVEDWLEANKKTVFKVSDVKRLPSSRSPSAPFTTSTLQQEASRKLGFSVRQTMTLAQRLYESGAITYMRTDSTNMSDLALNSMKSFILNEFGEQYHQYRQYKTKNENAQEAHEAIRPTDVFNQSAGDDNNQKKLYRLIWRRTIASQMSQAKLERTEIIIEGDFSNKDIFIAKGEILQFDGFIKVYGGGKNDLLLPNLTNNQPLELLEIKASETLSKPPARYSEASLVKKLEELGIGRPSTYAPTISTIQTRGYIEKNDLAGQEKALQELTLKAGKVTKKTVKIISGADKSKLIPTPVAEVVTDFLTKHFPNIVDYDFTAKVEQEFDNIATGSEVWNQMISNFYKEFHPLVKSSENISRQEVSQARELGKDPKTQESIFARFGRYGPMLVKGNIEDTVKKPHFAPLPPNTNLESVTLDEALEMFKLPRTVGKTGDGQEIIANIGRFGPYIKVNDTFVSIKGHDPLDITEDEAIKIYQEKLVKEAQKQIKTFTNGLKILKGPYGPYLTDGTKNIKIDKTKDPLKITQEEAKELFKKAPKLHSRRKFKKTS